MIRLLLLMPLIATAAPDPYLAESKVRLDLEDALSRLVPREQFFVQAHAEISTRSERKIVEGETTSLQAPKPDEPYIAPMPGFIPDVTPPSPRQPQQQSRQVFRMIDTPVLSAVRVHVNFDQDLKPDAILRAKMVVQNYLATTYANLASVTFGQIPMLKPPKPPEPPAPPPKPPEEKVKEPPKPEPDKFRENAHWILLGVVLFIAFMFWQTQRFIEAQFNRNRARRAPRPPGQPLSYPGFPPGLNPMLGMGQREPTEETKEDEEPEEVKLERLKKTLLAKFLARSDAFRDYYTKLPAEVQLELFGVLRGHAFERLLDGLAIKAPAEQPVDHPNPEECMTLHDKEFDEFLQGREWQSRQFFGFLNQLKPEQLVALAIREKPKNICLMLRFMKPPQSATVLDALSADRRRDVITQITSVEQMALSDIMNSEQEIRTVVQKMPSRLFSASEESDFWGGILSESQNQDTILEDIEKSNPEIYPKLKKFKFKLEDASSLPDGILERVFAEADNEELGLALATVSSDVAEVLLDAVSPKRRELLKHYVMSSKNAGKEQTKTARQTLTKRFREVMA